RYRRHHPRCRQSRRHHRHHHHRHHHHRHHRHHRRRHHPQSRHYHHHHHHHHHRRRHPGLQGPPDRDRQDQAKALTGTRRCRSRHSQPGTRCRDQGEACRQRSADR